MAACPHSTSCTFFKEQKSTRHKCIRRVLESYCMDSRNFLECKIYQSTQEKVSDACLVSSLASEKSIY